MALCVNVNVNVNVDVKLQLRYVCAKDPERMMGQVTWRPRRWEGSVEEILWSDVLVLCPIVMFMLLVFELLLLSIGRYVCTSFIY